MPGIRASDTLKAFQHGHFRGVDLAAGRVVDITFALIGIDSPDFFSNILPSVENAIVPVVATSAPELPLLLFNGTRLINVRPRKREPAYDAGNQQRVALVDCQFVASDPRVYDANLTTAQMSVAVSSAGLSWGVGANLLAADTAQFEWNAVSFPAPYMGGWAAVTNCAITQSSAQAAEGTKSMAMTSTAAGDMSARTLSGTSGTPVVAGTQYTELLSFRAAVSPRTCQVIIDWYNAAGALLSSSAGSGITSSTSAFTQASSTATAPAGAVTSAVRAYVTATGGASEVQYVDKASLAVGASTTWAAPVVAGATWSWTWGTGGSAGAVTVTNLGNFPTRPIVAIAGPVDNPQLQNGSTGEFVQFALSLTASDVLTVDFDAHSVLLNGTASRRNTLTSTSKWWELAPGTTQVLYSANTTQVGSVATMTFRSAWV
jgi:hypothetical protein